MSSYWRNDDKIKVSQTKISVPSTNGQSYSGKAGDGGKRVDFEIPPNVKFMDGKNSYLQFDVKLKVPTGGTPTRLQLDPFIGGQSLVKNIRIYSGNRGVLLEEIADYNAKVQMEYSYNQDESLRKMRALKEGCLVTSIANRGTEGTSESNLIDLNSNPYYGPRATAGTSDFGNDDFTTAKVCLPIHTGIFADSDKIFPVMMTQGLYIEIDLEDASRCIKVLDSVNRNRRMKQNPHFHGRDAAGQSLPVGDVERTEIFLGLQNNMRSVADCPFVRGERIGICSKTNPEVQPELVKSADDTEFYPKITDITPSGGGFVKLTVEAFKNKAVNGSSIEVTSDDFILFSAAMDTKRLRLDASGDPTADVGIQPTNQYDAEYEISNMEMVVQQVELDSRYEAGMMAKMKDGGSLELDIHSATNYKHSLLSTNRNATVNLDVTNTRAKSCLIIPTDAKVLNTAELIGGLAATYDEERIAATDGRLHSIRSGQVGIIDELTSYQFVIDDKLVPSRPVNVGKINKGKSISAQPLIELEKALNQAKIIPRSFCDYNRNFVIGRAYALNDGVANLNNRSNQLQLLYNQSKADGTDLPPQHNKLLMAFIYHIRRISIKGDSIVVSL
tara:strand:+ start:1561 stop:3402 length:1842 start_codon:yes stop_codon:yes gene_type:complete